jgi:hypothetical protein
MFIIIVKHSNVFGRMFQISWCWRLDGLNWLINNMFGNNLINIKSGWHTPSILKTHFKNEAHSNRYNVLFFQINSYLILNNFPVAVKSPCSGSYIQQICFDLIKCLLSLLNILMFSVECSRLADVGGWMSWIG